MINFAHFLKYANKGDIMRRRMHSKTIKLTKRAARFYTETQVQLLHDLFTTYQNRGGVLRWTSFVAIPMDHDEGDMTNERGEWTKYIRGRLAHDWDSIKCK